MQGRWGGGILWPGEEGLTADLMIWRPGEEGPGWGVLALIEAPLCAF